MKPDLEASGKWAREYLIRTAVESVEYVAFGKVMKKDVMDKFGLTEQMADAQLGAICLDLMERIRGV